MFLFKGDNCSCLNDDDVCHNTTDMLLTENCRDEDKRPLCGYQIFRFTVTEGKTLQHYVSTPMQYTTIFRLKKCQFLEEKLLFYFLFIFFWGGGGAQNLDCGF